MTPLERVAVLEEAQVPLQTGMRLCTSVGTDESDAHVVVVGYVVSWPATGASMFFSTKGIKLLHEWRAGYRRALPVPDLDDPTTYLLCWREALERRVRHAPTVRVQEEDWITLARLPDPDKLARHLRHWRDAT